MADHLVGTADQRRPRRRRLARGAGGLALAAGAGAGGFFAVAGGAATATSSSASARLSVVARSSLRRIFAVVGTVESLNTAANSFTVKDESGTTTTVTVSSATTYRDPGPDTASLRNVTVGEHVAVLGTTSAGAVRARRVLIGDDACGGGPLRAAPAVVGTVESVNTAANSFTVKDESGTTTTVTVSSATTYRDPGPDTASLRNVTVGEHVAVLGTTSAGAVRATSVLIGVPHHDGGWEKRAGLLPAGPGRGSPGPAA